MGCFFAQAAEIVDSGTCGDNLTWTLDKDGLLTISGTGEMRDYYNSSTPEIMVTVFLGDINQDGSIDYLDTMTALRYDAELVILNDDQLLAGDVNGDGTVDPLDAILVLRYDAGLIEDF